MYVTGNYSKNKTLIAKWLIFLLPVVKITKALTWRHTPVLRVDDKDVLSSILMSQMFFFYIDMEHDFSSCKVVLI